MLNRQSEIEDKCDQQKRSPDRPENRQSRESRRRRLLTSPGGSTAVPQHPKGEAVHQRKKHRQAHGQQGQTIRHIDGPRLEEALGGRVLHVAREYVKAEAVAAKCVETEGK